VRSSHLGCSHGCSYYASDFRAAESAWLRRLRLEELRGDELAVARTLGNLGLVQEGLGAYAKAIDLHEQALSLKTRLGDRGGVARTLGDIGTVYYHLGDHEKSRDFQERSVRLREELGDRGEIAIGLENLAVVLDAMGERERALETYQRTLRLEEELGNRARMATTLGNIGVLYAGLGDHAKALEFQRRALSIKEEAGDRAGSASTLGNIGSIHLKRGEIAAGLDALERSVAARDELGDDGGLVIGLTNLAAGRLQAGDAVGALDAARRAVVTVRELGTPLADDQAIELREQFASMFQTGLEAAARLGDVDQAAFFLEAGRAETLLPWLRGAAGLEEALVPEALRTPLHAALDAATLAANRLRDAVQGGDRAQIRERRSELEVARQAARDARERIQRQARSAADVLYPEVDGVDVIRGRLGVDEALAVYGEALTETYALVVTQDGVRLVPLGEQARIREAVSTLDLTSPTDDPTPALRTLRARLVDPLGLPDTTQRLLVSPSGGLAFVPFGLLFRGEVASVPSGTALGILRPKAGRGGEGVLALGDCIYDGSQPVRDRTRGEALVPLPGTREEARAVGDVVLLGAEATETRLDEVVATRPRWRAIHLACHGLLDARRPMLSCDTEAASVSHVSRKVRVRSGGRGAPTPPLRCMRYGGRLWFWLRFSAG